MIIKTILLLITLLFARLGVDADLLLAEKNDIERNSSGNEIQKEERLKREPNKNISNLLLFPPPEIPTDSLPEIEAKAALMMDEHTDTIIYEKEKDEQLPIASITKLMVAMVVIDEHESLQQTHTVINPNIIGADMELEEGENISLLSLLYGSLVASANDASQQLAIATAGSEEAFVEKMNEKAKSLHLQQTTFYNITGLDREEDSSIAQENVSTVFELAQIVDHSRAYPLIWKIVRRTRATVTSSDGSISHELHNTNQLLTEIPGLQGGKTGFTDRAGQSLVTLTERNGNSVITVILNSPDRFKETTTLIDWAYEQIIWHHCTDEEKCGTLK